jgi:hypothetical protein
MRQDFIEAILGLFQAVLIIGLIVTLMLKGREKDSQGGGKKGHEKKAGRPHSKTRHLEHQGSSVQGSRFKVQGSRFWVQGSRFKVQGSRFRVQGSRFKVLG